MTILVFLDGRICYNDASAKVKRDIGKWKRQWQANKIEINNGKNNNGKNRYKKKKSII